jgi:hypothetical protein
VSKFPEFSADLRSEDLKKNSPENIIQKTVFPTKNSKSPEKRFLGLI